MAKKDKKINYSELNEKELMTRLEKAHQDLFKTRFRAAAVSVKNTMHIRVLRREIARLNTFVNQRRRNP